ncbi:MAG TPA: serine/threonine-protein phosphatase, partial [Opitutaceae bacterium]|nr:serine/threonine-protein phosphatase [Opitutaceae bacterium]
MSLNSPTPPPTPSFPSDPATVAWSGLTDRGRVRANNEDAFLALTVDAYEVRYLGKTGEGSLSASDFVFAVSDGMGGAKSGEIASKLAVDRITQLLPPH